MHSYMYMHIFRHETSDYEGRKTIERDQFRLRHYAGDVTYNIEGMWYGSIRVFSIEI